MLSTAMFAWIGVMRALNRHVERVFNPDRKDHHWAAGTNPARLRLNPGQE